MFDRPAIESLSALNECLRNLIAVGEYEPIVRAQARALS